MIGFGSLDQVQVTEIQGGDSSPPEPDWASIFVDEFDIATAHEEWGIVIRELKASITLSVANGHEIRRLVEFRIQYTRASNHVAEHGPILRPANKKAKVGQWNPYWSVMRQANEAIRSLEAELGIAPTRRGNATKVNRGKKTSRAADEFLRPVSG